MKDIFCQIIEGSAPSYTCYEDEYVKAIMDVNPDVAGHTLIIPKIHYTAIVDMEDEIMTHIDRTARMLVKRMEERFSDIIGVRVIVNYGKPQIVKHFHMHLIPVYAKGKNPDSSIEEMCSILKDN